MIKNNIAPFVFYSVAFAFAASGAPAGNESDWQVYSEEPNGDVYFYDTSRVTRDADVHKVWTRIRYKRSVMGASSYQSLLEIDCAARSEQTVQRTFFSDREWQDPAMSTDMNAKPKRPIRDGSAADRLSEVLCTQ